jgi:hypothetical protein
MGDLGWTQRANFLVTGGLTLASAVGLRRALRPLGGSSWWPLVAFGGLLQRATVTLGLPGSPCSPSTCSVSCPSRRPPGGVVLEARGS